MKAPRAKRQEPKKRQISNFKFQNKRTKAEEHIETDLRFVIYFFGS